MTYVAFIVVMLAVGMMIERAQLDVADGLGAVDWVVTGDRW